MRFLQIQDFPRQVPRRSFHPGAGSALSRIRACLCAGLIGLAPMAIASPDSSGNEAWNLYGQITHVSQAHGAFKSPYQGANSLDGGARLDSTNDFTLFVGARLWRGGELYLNPEIDEGFGLSNTQGIAGFPSANAYKVGAHHPYLRLPRAFFRQTIDLGGAQEVIGSGPNQLAGTRSTDHIVLTLGKLSIPDIFDTNIYAHDPRGDFMNWSIIEAGAFDYAADSWGFSKGIAIEWTQSWWTLRGGLFTLSSEPNGERLDSGFRQYGVVTEFEERHQWGNRAGKFKVLGFINRGNMGRYTDALLQIQGNGTAPDTGRVRRMQSRPGIAFNLEQALAPNLGFFARTSWNDGSKEAFDFTEINRSLSAGLSLAGQAWGHAGDTAGIAIAVNGLSSDARRYFEQGGMGILIGDGRLNYGKEKIFEGYYAWAVTPEFHLTADLQYIDNPAYNRDRGPVTVYGLRAHLDF
ncbi:MAG: carbohydrate porin [Proteobacteria bacterium]|nr:carbohydrate porin [Pseudomonadota bacterium]HQR02945.1 carbohydrate porin [Rhodocyclaceae bacterium]